MHPYFFDIVAGNSVRLDFHGRKMASPEDAHDLAEMIALDMGCSSGNNEEPATEVVVRDVRGASLYTVGVRYADLIAA